MQITDEQTLPNELAGSRAWLGQSCERSARYSGNGPVTDSRCLKLESSPEHTLPASRNDTPGATALGNALTSALRG